MEPQAPTDDLLHLTLELAGSLDARTVMGRILERSLAVASADRATLSSIAGDRLIIEASVGTGGEITWVGRGYGAESLLRQPLVHALLDTRRTVLGGPMAVSEALPEFRDALGTVKHTATVPILESGELVGMLVLSRHRDQPFLESDIPSLTGFGALAGLALRNAKLYETATSASRRLQAAAEAAADVAALQDLPALLQRIVQHAGTAAEADVAALMRLAGDVGVVEATSGVAPVGTRWPLSSAVEAAVRAGRTIEVAASQSESGADPESYAARYGHALVTPLQFAGDLLGILVVGRFRGRTGYSPGDIAGLRQFATLAALVLHNGRLVHRLLEAEKMKREFMNIAVHELRGPLTVIEGYTELLINDAAARQDATVVERQLATIRRQAEHARTLAEDLLTLARIESDDLGVGRDVVGTAALVTAAVERSQPRARLRSGRVELQAGDDARALGDATLVARILDNLVSNAIIYSVDPPAITITIAADPHTVHIRVQDGGPGVPEAERESIFARFARGTRTGGTQGSGLGLYLSRECARRMGGDLVLEDTSAGGSRFVLTLPAA
ncbi:MAG: ATP-binding protein [Candidatus Dormibacteria bacterium]